MRLKLMLIGILFIIVISGCVKNEVLPSSCDFPDGIDCSNLKITKNTISFHITNNLPEDIGTIQFKAEGCSDSTAHGMRKGDVKIYTLTNCNNEGYIEKTIAIPYNYRSIDFSDTKTGTIKGNVE